jgi:putative ABC transport system ATP-binding protein
MKPPARLRLEEVSKHYTTPAGVVRAVDGISLDVKGGTSLAITGPSGCGKSTLLGLIGGLDLPTEGRILIDEQPISTLSERARVDLRHSELGFVFQSDNLLPFLTAVENVGLQLALNSSADGYERCVELLERLGLDDSIDRLPDQLSGGQRQRVAVARALVHEPRVVLADEPTGSLDADNSALILELLVAAQHERHTTLVVVTHDLEVARQLDATIAMRDGKLERGATGSGPRSSGRARC